MRIGTMSILHEKNYSMYIIFYIIHHKALGLASVLTDNVS